MPTDARSHITVELVRNWRGTIHWFEPLVVFGGAIALVAVFSLFVGWVTKP